MRVFLVIFSLFLFTYSNAQKTCGLMLHKVSSDDNGYILFSPINFNTTYLIDKCGKMVHSWKSNYNSGMMTAFLLPDGTLLKTGENSMCGSCQGGVIEKLDWDGNVLWTKTIANSVNCQHHGILPLPDGNFLAIISESKSKEEALAAGFNPEFLHDNILNEKVVEIKCLGKDSAQIVWEWSLWDHVVQDFDNQKKNYGIVAQHPELVNFNYHPAKDEKKTTEIVHCNSLDYNPELDQIMMTTPLFNEVWIIDHGTSSKEASGHKGGRYGKGGDLLYRWGNPAAYNKGSADDQRLFYAHNGHWIKKGLPFAGDIIFFNNGAGRKGNIKYSTIEIIKTPVTASGKYVSPSPFLPSSSIWTYGDTTNSELFSPKWSSAQMLPGGNILVCSGTKGKMIEIDSMKNIIWKYYCPVNEKGPVVQGAEKFNSLIFSCNLYFGDYDGLKGRKLIPGQPIELGPSNDDCNIKLK